MIPHVVGVRASLTAGEDGEDAVARVVERGESFDCILMDENMVRLNGSNGAQRRRTFEAPTHRLVLMSCNFMIMAASTVGASPTTMRLTTQISPPLVLAPRRSDAHHPPSRGRDQGGPRPDHRCDREQSPVRPPAIQRGRHGRAGGESCFFLPAAPAHAASHL